MISLNNPDSELYIPDHSDLTVALTRTTHLGIGAHQDDLEVMCVPAIIDCYGSDTAWFSGIIVTNGSGSARDGAYAAYSDDDMMAVRREEQKKAAHLGDYSVLALLNHSSATVKDPQTTAAEDDILRLLVAMKPQYVYIHNLADKHPTHIGVAMNTLRAIRRMPREIRPKQLIGCEVWRALDWMPDNDKVVLAIRNHENLAQALIGVFDSQVAGGKRYDLAIMGRRRANATFFQSHSVDSANLIDFGMDLTPLVEDDTIDPCEFVLNHINNFANDVRAKISAFNR